MWSLFTLCLLFTGALSRSVPVLLWESSPLSEKEDLVPALNFMDTDDFSNYLVNKIHALKPLVVLFLEPTLSVEDFSWQDDSRLGAFTQVQNLTSMAAKVEFMPSVQDPVAAIKDLVVSHGYTYAKYDETRPMGKPSTVLEVALSDPSASEDRPTLLRRHDSAIARVYSDLLASSPRIVAVYTGRQSSWVEAQALNRVRRAAADNSSASSIVYNTKDVMIESTSEPTLDVDGNTTILKGPVTVAEKFRRQATDGQQRAFSEALTAEDRTVFFTPAIWMGIIVMFVLLSILAWGISMLMDIKTMDRFDDPKGKTIIVNAVD